MVSIQQFKFSHSAYLQGLGNQRDKLDNIFQLKSYVTLSDPAHKFSKLKHKLSMIF